MNHRTLTTENLITINLLQIFQHHAHIDFAFYRKVLLLTLPPIAVFLAFSGLVLIVRSLS